jgi:hypothetical protein
MHADLFLSDDDPFRRVGCAPTIGPRVSSSSDTVVVPIRFVNQFESGTSSIVLMLIAPTPVGL